MRLLPAAALIATGALALSSCAGDSSAKEGDGEETTKVEHAQGTTEVPVDPERVVVLDFGVLDSVDALGGDGVVGVPKTGLPKSLQDYAGDDVTDLGNVKEFDVEAVAEADPDVILVAARSAAKYDELNEIAPTVDLTLGEGDYLKEFKEQTNQIGTVLGKEQQAKDAYADVEDKVEEVRKDAKGAKDAMILLVSGGKISAYGPGTRSGSIIHDTAGVEPTASDLKKDPHGQAVSFEFVADKEPSTLFVIDRDAAIGEEGKTAKQVLDNPLVAKTPAWKQDRVTYLDATDWYLVSSGLNALPRMLDEVASGIE
ncbi:siderophore ABC transporter substrate-binding protein [Janibacter corallicola]|uniref:siderophore ABC transporter substrate-binding protein n=1 Tax=Janibacter corallicola TaxID=415212 RepID=UPI000A447C4D|nr:siderophore ABC transporter substrate-binding protein [Janibacter corallicola]